MQILMAFEPYCNIKIRGWEKNRTRFFYLCFVLEISNLKHLIDAIEYNSWQKINLWISSHSFLVNYDCYKGTFFPLWKNVITESGARQISKQANFHKLFRANNLTHSFPVYPFSTPWKHQKTLRSVHWERMG